MSYPLQNRITILWPIDKPLPMPNGVIDAGELGKAHVHAIETPFQFREFDAGLLAVWAGPRVTLDIYPPRLLADIAAEEWPAPAPRSSIS